VGVCVCREEPACLLVKEIRKLWKMVYDFSSLAGMPFAGKTGFMKMQKYAPHDQTDTRFLCLAFPHIAWMPDGQIGKDAPLGRGKSYSGCSGLVAFQQELASGPSPWEPDPDNLEQGLLNQRLFRNMKYGEGSDVVTLTKLAYSIILQDVEKLLGLTLANLENPYALVTGIQLNSHAQQDAIWPGEMYEVIPRKRIALSLT
jgi:Limiting CO2-inducible proteins B/C beta carbonyic anhydrases